MNIRKEDLHLLVDLVNDNDTKLVYDLIRAVIEKDHGKEIIVEADNSPLTEQEKKILKQAEIDIKSDGMSLIGMIFVPRYAIKLTKPAVKYYEQLPPKIKSKVNEVINQLRENPFAIPNVKPLEESHHDDFRIRLGSLRLLYRIHNDTLIIVVLDIGPRGDIYK